MPTASAAQRESSPRRGPGAPLGVEHGLAKLDDHRVRIIRALHREGVPNAVISRATRVSATTVAQVVLRRTWRHVLDEAR